MKFEFDELDKIVRDLEKLSDKTTGIAKSVLYDGAKVVADEIKGQLQSIPVDELSPGRARYVHKGAPKLEGLTSTQKADAIRQFGVARHKVTSDGVETSIGFYGYTANGAGIGNSTPIPMLIRSLESGTTVMKKTPIIRKTVLKAKPAAQRAMQKKLDDIANNVFK